MPVSRLDHMQVIAGAKDLIERRVGTFLWCSHEAAACAEQALMHLTLT